MCCDVTPVYDNHSTDRCMYLENSMNIPVVGLNCETHDEPTSFTNLNVEVHDVISSSSRFLCRQYIKEYGPESLKYLNSDVRYMPAAFWEKFLTAIISNFEWIIDNETTEGHNHNNNGIKILTRKDFTLCLPYLQQCSHLYNTLSKKLELNVRKIRTRKLSINHIVEQCPEVLKFIVYTYSLEDHLSGSYIPNYFWIITPHIIDFSIVSNDMTNLVIKNMDSSVELQPDIQFIESQENSIAFDAIEKYDYRTVMSITIKKADADICRALEQLESLLLTYKWAGALVCVNVKDGLENLLSTC